MALLLPHIPFPMQTLYIQSQQGEARRRSKHDAMDLDKDVDMDVDVIGQPGAVAGWAANGGGQ